jgi:hypothetical protein
MTFVIPRRPLLSGPASHLCYIAFCPISRTIVLRP